MKKEFVHLHTHSHYSLLEALPKIKALASKAKQYDSGALAITDYGNLYGAIDLYKTCEKNGLKPIVGMETFLASKSHLEPEDSIDNKTFHLVLLAKSERGYKNLIHFATIGNIEGVSYRPRIDEKILFERSEDFFVLAGSQGSELAHLIENGRIDDAKNWITKYKQVFADNLYLEITYHPEDEHDTLRRETLATLGKEMNVPLVAGYNTHYIEKQDKDIHLTLLEISSKHEKERVNINFKQGNYSYKSPEEAWEDFKDFPEALENTLVIRDACNLSLTLGEWTFPLFEIEENVDADTKLRELAYAGLLKKGIEKTEVVEKRIEYELEVIKMKGFSIYLLIVGDLLRYAKENNIVTTIRGSVAGSLVTYLIGITNVNPLDYKLPFERFLNPERPSAPDIDMDYADNRRDEMLDYARAKYGKEKVAQIGTFGTMAARGSVKDVARALGYPYSTGDRISKMIPMGSQGFPMTINRALEMIPELNDAYEGERDVREILDYAKGLEGNVRHISVHAAGVVISPGPLEEFVPTQKDPKGGKIITQYDMHGVEDAGLIKFDFLGIRNLAILGDAVRLVKKLQEKDVDLEAIALDDPKTFKLLAEGKTIGLFQLNGSGMTKWLKELKPTTIHDINAMVALYRPGPMEMIPEYIKRKYNPHLISYLDPRMKSILDQSFGVITYQDDVMMIAIELAGYSWLEADKLRKAMGKKIPELMEEQKQKLFKGLEDHGMNDAKIRELWALIEPFAAYGFNKAHAASYGRVAYQTAFMKANFPVEYMTAILTAESGDIEKISEIIRECNNMNIEVMPPNINESFGGFTIVGELGSRSILFGLYTIKNLGYDISDAIIEERKKSGPFTSLEDFFERVNHKGMTKKAIESLTKSGALDCLSVDRATILKNMESLLDYNRQIHQKNANQNSLFESLGSMPKFSLVPAEPLSMREQLVWEKELLGVYISGHPLDSYQEKINGNGVTIQKIIEQGRDNQEIVLACHIDDVRVIITKKNQQMAFVKISDHTSAMEIVVFPDLYAEVRKLCQAGALVALRGKISLRNGEKSIIVDKLKILD
jgi:DNA polymerase-3 subunit alpha